MWLDFYILVQKPVGSGGPFWLRHWKHISYQLITRVGSWDLLAPSFALFFCFFFPGNNISSFCCTRSLLSQTTVKSRGASSTWGKGFNSRDRPWLFQDTFDSCLSYTTSWRFSVAGRLSASGRLLLLKSNSPQQTVDLAVIFLSVSHAGFLFCNCWVGFLRVWIFPPIFLHRLLSFSFAL